MPSLRVQGPSYFWLQKALRKDMFLRKENKEAELIIRSMI